MGTRHTNSLSSSNPHPVLSIACTAILIHSPDAICTAPRILLNCSLAGTPHNPIPRGSVIPMILNPRSVGTTGMIRSCRTASMASAVQNYPTMVITHHSRNYSLEPSGSRSDPRAPLRTTHPAAGQAATHYCHCLSLGVRGRIDPPSHLRWLTKGMCSRPCSMTPGTGYTNGGSRDPVSTCSCTATILHRHSSRDIDWRNPILVVLETWRSIGNCSDR